MSIILDHVSRRYFEKDIRELARKELLLNFRLAYNAELGKWRKTEIRYNDLMFYLFNVPSTAIGDRLVIDVPFSLELFPKLLDDGTEVYLMVLNVHS